jgi:hypothetical protein
VASKESAARCRTRPPSKRKPLTWLTLALCTHGRRVRVQWTLQCDSDQVTIESRAELVDSLTLFSATLVGTGAHFSSLNSSAQQTGTVRGSMTSQGIYIGERLDQTDWMVCKMEKGGSNAPITVLECCDDISSDRSHNAFGTIVTAELMHIIEGVQMRLRIVRPDVYLVACARPIVVSSPPAPFCRFYDPKIFGDNLNR